MLWLLLQKYPKSTFYIVFANTGKEREETLVFVHECATRWNVHIEWIEAKINPGKGEGTSYTVVDFKTASRNGEPFTAMMQKYGQPSQFTPKCSRELKIVPIQKWVKGQLSGRKYEMAIGLRYDEQDRRGEFWYPLMDWGITKSIVRDFWMNQDFDLQLKDYEGNCDLCFKKSINKKLTLIEERPESVKWWQDAEAKYGKGKVMSRGFASYQKLEELSKHGKFRRAIDGEVITNQTIMDFGYSCTCGVPDPNEYSTN